MFSSGPHYDKLKTNLRLAINRMKLLQKKKTEEALKARKEIADYIKAGKPDRAKIRVEHIIREDYMVEVLEMLELYCDLLLARFGLIQNMKDIDPALEEPVCTLIWCSPRMFSEVQELKPVADQLTHKYGTKYVQEFCHREDSCKASQRVRTKMSVAAPPPIMVERYLMEIAKSYNVDYQPDQMVLAQAEANSAQAHLLDFAASNSVPAPINAAQFADVKMPMPTIPQNGPFVAQPFAGAYPPSTGMMPPPYIEKPEPSFTERPNPDAPRAAGFNVNPVRPSAPDDTYSFGVARPTQPPNSNSNAAAASAPPPIGFVLPDVPSDLSAPSAGNGANNDPDFDELQRRFEELKRKK